jgi:hypothetical protein
VSPVATLHGSPPPPPPPPTSPLERPYGWSSSDSGPARSASGEIHVQTEPPSRKSLPYGQDVPRVHVREDSGKAYVRKSTATPPGSARALDEPPPVPAQAEALARPITRELAKPVASASKTIKVDDGRDAAFSKADAEDELGVSSRGRRVLVAVGVVMLVFRPVRALP